MRNNVVHLVGQQRIDGKSERQGFKEKLGLIIGKDLL